GLGLDWQVDFRTGDTTTSRRKTQLKKPPHILITTPESLHLLLASKGYTRYFSQLKVLVADEWHELMGNKRGVMLELALSRLYGFLPNLRTWGISATIGNMEEAMAVLFGSRSYPSAPVLVRARHTKIIQMHTILPDEVETFPWAGHLGISLLPKVVPIIMEGQSTLIFTNTRAQCEIWYQRLLEVVPDLAGQLAMHHGSLDRKLRDWVENALHEGTLKAVVCTSSLDLGVDFRPVEKIIQVGSPKGVARFLQRAGRSGHQPGAPSTIYFVPTHSLEIFEGAALRQATREQALERRVPYIRSFDVLVQYLITLALSEGFRPAEVLAEIRSTFSFASVTEAEWSWCLQFITTGGSSLGAYDEYRKVEVEDGLYKVNSRRVALRHRLSIGAIVSDTTLRVKYLKGAYLGNIEEWFVAQLEKGDTFWFAGRSLALVRVKDMTVYVRRSKAKKGRVPSWMGGRLQLSSRLGDLLRRQIAASLTNSSEPELQALQPLLEMQQRRSIVPRQDELLIEYFKDREGYHLLVYPFEGYYVHEGLANLLAYRLGQRLPITFSIAMNDYGFELLSDQDIPIREAIAEGLFC
ncbi:MAG: DEAD/DEAH box helicase, partial [Bacteroidetes bacterium]